MNDDASKEHGAIERNEAILLLGFFAPEANDITKSPSRQYAEFIAEAGRLWSRVRPEGGLPKVDRMRERWLYGRALEGWAREYLGAPALPVAYASDKVRDMHWRMTGRQMQTSDAPVGADAVTETERLLLQNQVVIMDALIALLQASVSGRLQRQQLEDQKQRSVEHVRSPRHSMVGP